MPPNASDNAYDAQRRVIPGRPTCGVVCNGLGQHGLAAAGRSVHQHPPGGVDANLLVQLKVGQRKLHCLSDLLLLNVQTSNVRILDVGLLV